LEKIASVLEFNKITLQQLDSAFISGFDMASQTGPLMDEPMQGAIFLIDDVELNAEVVESGKNLDQYGPFSGQVMSTVKQLCKKAFLNSDPRIVEGMYMCSMQASPETYGIVYSVINKVRGRVVKEEV